MPQRTTERVVRQPHPEGGGYMCRQARERLEGQGALESSIHPTWGIDGLQRIDSPLGEGLAMGIWISPLR